MFGMIHQRERLSLGLETGDHLPRIHAELDDLERDPPAHRLLLLGHEHDAAAAFAQSLQQLVAADSRPRGILARNTSRPASRIPGRAGEGRFSSCAPAPS